MDALLEQFRSLALSADDLTRVEMSNALAGLQAEIEQPAITVFRLSNATLQLAALKSLVQIGALKVLAEAPPAGLSAADVAAKCNVPDHWLVPLLRVVGAGRFVKEVGPGQYTANAATIGLSKDSSEASIRYISEGINPIFARLPEFLAKNEYKPPAELTRTPFQHAMNTDLAPFAFLATLPERLRDFQLTMSTTTGLADWLSVFPFEDETKDWSPGKPLFVDIGGGFGTQCRVLLEKQPQAKGRVILQDLKDSIDKAPEIPGAEKMVHDFFQPQPIKGAKFYYLRLVLHDWPHAKAAEILRSVKSGMEPGSKLLIDETVIPTTGVSWTGALADMMMRTSFFAPERTADEWQRLLEEAGFKMERMFPYAAMQGMSVIMAAPA